jgi:hypothetical protein
MTRVIRALVIQIYLLLKKIPMVSILPRLLPELHRCGRDSAADTDDSGKHSRLYRL